MDYVEVGSAFLTIACTLGAFFIIKRRFALYIHKTQHLLISKNYELDSLQRYYRLLIDTAPSLIFVTDSDLNLIELNQSFAEMFGKTRNDMVNNHLQLYIQSEDVLNHIQRDTNNVLKTSQTEHGGSFELLNIKTGEIQTFTLSRKILRNGKTGVITVASDITNFKSALQELKRTQDKYLKLIESSSNLILQVSSEGIITFCNDSSVKHLGYRPEELIGLEWTNIIVPEKRNFASKQFGRWASWATKFEERFEIDIVSRNGIVKNIMWDIKIFWNKDTFIGVKLDGSDITALKKVQGELRENNKLLEQANQKLLYEQSKYKALLETYERAIRISKGDV